MRRDLLKGKMAEKNMSQAQLAKEIGISTNSVNRKLSGKREFTISEVVDICRVLAIDDPREIFFT